MRSLLFAHPRTGTTYLRNILNTHPSIYFYGEVLYPDYFSWGFYAYLRWKGVDISLPAETYKHIVPFLNSITGVMEDAGKSVIGFDFKIPQCNLICDFHKSIDKSLFSVIHLCRKNQLDAIVSYEIMNIRNTNSIPPHAMNIPPPISISLDTETLLTRLKRFSIEDDEINSIYNGKSSYLRVYYEDITSDESQKCLQEIADFLGVCVSEFQAPSLVKQNPLDLSKKIINFDEVKSLLLQTEFSHCVL